MMRWLGALCLVSMAWAQTPRYLPLDPDPRGLEVVQAILVAPTKMNARELGAWQMLCSGLLEGTQDFVREDIFTYGSQAGVSPRVYWTNDYVRLQWVAPKGGEGIVARLLESVLTHPDCSDERLGLLRNRLSAETQDDWFPVLAGQRGDLTLPAEFVKQFANRAFRPESLSIAATPGALRAIGGRFSDWRPPRTLADIRVAPFGKFRGPDRAQIIRFDADPILPTTNAAPLCLALVALGGGKTALLHQVAREEHAWSYRQEAFLVPERTGWRPTIMLAGAQPLPTNTILRTALSDRAAKLTADDLDRVRQLATMSLQGRNPLSPFWLSAEGPFNGTPLDRTAWNAWVSFWGVENATPEALLADMKRVTLDELKEALANLIQGLR